MFTDDKMELEYSKSHNAFAALQILLEDCFDASNKDKAESNTAIPANKIKQANNIWKLFASRHKEINPNGFKETLIKFIPQKEEYINNILK